MKLQIKDILPNQYVGTIAKRIVRFLRAKLRPTIGMNAVLPGYFRTMQIPIFAWPYSAKA